MMQKTGFTLIEVLITTIIITVFSLLSLAGYRYFNEQRKLEEATNKFVEVLELAKKNAIVGYRSQIEPLCGGIPNGDFRISVQRGSSIYTFGGATSIATCIVAMSQGDSGFYYFVSKTDSTIIVNAINDTDLYDNGFFDFKAFGLGIKAMTPNTVSAPLDATGGFSVTLKNTVTNQTKTIQVNHAGTISVQ